MKHILYILFSQDFEYRVLDYFLDLNIEIVQLMLSHSITISYREYF